MLSSLLPKLRCPVSGESLILSRGYLVCNTIHSRYRYPVKNGVPVLLPDEAVRISEQEWHAMMQNVK